MTDNTNDNGPKLVSLPEQKSEAAAAGEKLKRDLLPMMETAKTIARYRRAAFLAYVAEGFSEPQALELCCK